MLVYSKSLLLAFVAAVPTVCLAAGPFRTIFSAEPSICKKFQVQLMATNSCRLTDEDCFTSKWGDGLGLTRELFNEVAVNEYGYTGVWVSKPSGASYSLVYLNGFNGDHRPRLLETWKVEAKALDSLFAQTPGPLPYEERMKGGRGVTQETWASEFAQILAHGEKLSDEWAPVWMPVFKGAGIDYAVSRECSGVWAFGGYYNCAKAIKIVVKRVSNDRKAISICEFSRR